MNDSPYEVANYLINKIEKYLWCRQYRDGIIDRDKVTIYLGEKERQAMLRVYNYASANILDNTLLGCKVIFVKEESHFNIV